MLMIGSRNQLTATRFASPGLFLDGGDDGDILLPTRLVPAGAKPGDILDVFVYLDSEDRLVATTEQPLAEVGEAAWLKVRDVNDAGAFLDWGLPKDLLLPYNEQPRELKRFIEPGRYCMVMVFVDDSGRIAASARLDDFIAQEASDISAGQQVSLVIADKTEIGVRVIVNNRFWGLLYTDEIFQPLQRGEKHVGYVRKLRIDQRLDISLSPQGREKTDSASQDILDQLEKNGGFMAVSDKSPPELIYKVFGVSKKVFKQAIGALYKERRIVIESGGIRLADGMLKR